MNIYKKLINVQIELKAPKNQYNSFGKYKYRSCEDVLEALKPILNCNGLTLILGDEIINVEGRFYIKSTAKLIDIDTGEKIETAAIAREEEVKKGMDSSQITGSCSSYARKYALNGLFLIDDTKDSDSTNTNEESKKEVKKEVKLDKKTKMNEVWKVFINKFADKAKEEFTKETGLNTLDVEEKKANELYNKYIRVQ
jgi:hypothetical protein